MIKVIKQILKDAPGLYGLEHYSDINWVDLDAHQILPLLKKTVLGILISLSP